MCVFYLTTLVSTCFLKDNGVRKKPFQREKGDGKRRERFIRTRDRLSHKIFF